MKISRMNIDFGNSMYMNLVDGYFFEMPTNVVEIKEDVAEGKFASSIEDPNDLKDRLMISTEIDGENRFFLVGEIAQKEVLGNNHIRRLHNKVDSHIPLVMFLAATAYYHALNPQNIEKEENELQIDYFQTMLPIWLLKKTNKFSEMQEQMANKFKGTHHVKVLTFGMEKDLTINVLDAACRIESEVARWGIKKTFELTDNEMAKQFQNSEVVLCDLGGGTDDLVLLPEGLKAPKSRESFVANTEAPFLLHLENLRKDKLLEHFDNVRDLEKFIYSNIAKSKLERRDGNTGEKFDLTNIIRKSLKEFTEIKISQCVQAFTPPKDTSYKYVYFGGVGEVLSEMIGIVAEEKFGREIAESNHIVADDARLLNLFGLEVLSRAEQKKREAEKK
ncbi:Alp7A family actin-like protein [Bacillus altitudinis]|uniref:Alp7A family actin-like protein n=1 Tax=Bacillus altitudinis TaxID=293387 RepID=UPI00064CD56A|nr:membrane protein [Bacillus altitudinis]KLV14970.1 membrane protein [Bacillus altitudinis]